MKRMTVFALIGLVALVACRPGPPTPTEVPTATPPPQPRRLTLMTHDSFGVSEEVVAVFEAQENVTMEFLKAGDAGFVLNQAILSRENPLADLLFGVDSTFLSRALEADIFEPYASPLLAEVPDELELDPQHRALPVDYGDVCLNYDKAWFAGQGLEPPGSLEDLVRPEYRGLTVVENPATSSPGLAFLLATVGHFGETGDYTYLNFWADLRANDVLVTEGWEDAYYGQASWWDGERPIVVSYATSPAAEVYFSQEALTEPPTGNVMGDGACFRQIEFVGILKGTPNRDLAEAWVDFMLSTAFQEDIPLQMWVFPASKNAVLPEVFARFAEIPQHPAYVSPEAIEANREAWIEAWTEVVIR